MLRLRERKDAGEPERERERDLERLRERYREAILGERLAGRPRPLLLLLLLL